MAAGDQLAGLYYAGAAATSFTGGSSLTLAGFATKGKVLLGLGPKGWLVYGLVLTGATIYLAIRGSRAIMEPLERWLDSSTFGRRRRPDAPTFSSLEAEENALVDALYGPVAMEKRFSRRLGRRHYLAELTLFLPGYNARQSRRSVTVNGQPAGALPRMEPAGATFEYKMHLDKRQHPSQANWEVRYRPSPDFESDLTLTVNTPESKAEQ